MNLDGDLNSDDEDSSYYPFSDDNAGFQPGRGRTLPQKRKRADSSSEDEEELMNGHFPMFTPAKTKKVKLSDCMRSFVKTSYSKFYSTDDLDTFLCFFCLPNPNMKSVFLYL